MSSGKYRLSVKFASANGYSGFRSNFANVFSPEKISKLFVVKGGPGTGKSTLMKRISEYFHDKADITHILCSSDPRSLDGVIIEGSNGAVAVADGTSPHAIEPSYPGVFERLIDLGEGCDIIGLERFKNEIIELVAKKKEAYKNAYLKLGLAGEIKFNIDL